VLAYHDQLEPPSKDDLWSATTDNRIRAILPIEPCYGQLFGEKGLAAITIPTLLIAGKADQICPYNLDSAYMYTHLGSPDRYLVTANKRDHFTLVINDSDMIQQYTSAFFGLYLQGDADYAQYLTLALLKMLPFKHTSPVSSATFTLGLCSISGTVSA
jgi:predicted dienelactone hydrolase